MQDKIIALVNAKNSLTLAVADVTFGLPAVVAEGTRNTSVELTGVSARGYTGTVAVFYNRVELEAAYPATIAAAPEVFDAFTDIASVVTWLNAQQDYTVLADQVSNGVLPTVVDQSLTIELLPAPNSLAFIGSRTIVISRTAEDLENLVTDPELDGLDTGDL